MLQSHVYMARSNVYALGVMKFLTTGSNDTSEETFYHFLFP